MLKIFEQCHTAGNTIVKLNDLIENNHALPLKKIRNTRIKLPELINESFRGILKRNHSIDHCFENEMSLKRWFEVCICSEHSAKQYTHKCEIYDNAYTITHNGVIYCRPIESDVSINRRSYPLLEKKLRIKSKSGSSRLVNETYEVDSILKHYYVNAQYGDIAKQATLVDERVRRGHEISLQNCAIVEEIDRYTEINEDDMNNANAVINEYFSDQNGKICISSELINKIHKNFVLEAKIANVEIVPYKLNFYHKGDYFIDHKDTPEENLIATIILLISGESYDMVLDSNNKWTTGRLLIMFPDVLHRVEPVSEYRETMTFKVFSKWKPTPFHVSSNVINDVIIDDVKFDDVKIDNVKIDDAIVRILTKFENFVNVNNIFAVLLQNEYTLENVIAHNSNGIFPYKGVDQKLAEIMEIIKYKHKLNVIIVPVILECYRYTSVGNSDRGYNEEELRSLAGSESLGENTHELDQNACVISCFSKELLQEMFGFDEEKDADLINKLTKISRGINVYTIGYGDATIGKALYERITHNVHYGNEYKGTLTSAIYWHVVMYATTPN